MNEEMLKAIDALLESIGEGPWEFTRNNGIRLLVPGGDALVARIVNAPEGDIAYIPDFPWSPDAGNAIATLICTAPGTLAALVAEVRRIRGRVATLEARMKTMKPRTDGEYAAADAEDFAR